MMKAKVDEETLNNMDVVGNFLNWGQYQIIIGSGTVNKVFNELEKITGKRAYQRHQMLKISRLKI